MTARSDLAEALAPLAPGWKIVTAERALDRIDKLTLQLRQSTYRPGPASGSLYVDFTVSLITPHQDIDRAEDDLDEAVARFLTELTSIPWLSWSSATKKVYADQWPCYDFTLTIQTTS